MLELLLNRFLSTGPDFGVALAVNELTERTPYPEAALLLLSLDDQGAIFKTSLGLRGIDAPVKIQLQQIRHERYLQVALSRCENKSKLIYIYA